MEKIYNTLIIGGGASGLIAAALLADKIGGENIILLEKNDRLGKKLSQTGNGQGNLTNSLCLAGNFHSGRADFPQTALARFGNREAEAFYNSLGVFLSGEGRRYPLSRQAGAVTDALRFKLAHAGVNVCLGCQALSLDKRGGVFAAACKDAVYYAENCVLAFGGKAAKQYGTDGSAYALAEGFGHTLTELTPSLVQLKTELEPLRGLKGIRADACVEARGDYALSARGDVLFTEFGVSGSAIFSVSGAVARGGVLDISFLPDVGMNELLVMLKARAALGFSGEELAGSLLHGRLGRAIYARSDGSAADFARHIKKFTLKVTGTLGFNYAQVTKGGISVEEVDARTMESKLCGGLYIVGEALDVDGDCGGYNLQWAFSSAACAACGIGEKTDEGRA